MPFRIFATVLLLAVGSSPAPPVGARPAAAVTSLRAAIADVEAGRTTTPLVSATAAGDFTVTFLAKASGGEAPRIVSDVTGWGERTGDNTFDFTIGRMAPVGRTGWYSLAARVAPAARVEYLIAYGRTVYRPDPHNPRRSALGSIHSEVVTPGYVAPRDRSTVPVTDGGRVDEASVPSAALGDSRRVLIYTPPGYRTGRAYPLVVFHDLYAEVRECELPARLDTLIAGGEVDPFVGVFADSARRDDGGDAGAIRTFLGGELPAWIASRYAVRAAADERTIVGVSFGAKDALDAAVTTGAFGRVGLLIPGRRLQSADIASLAAAARGRPLRLAVLAGRYDRANVDTARSVRRSFAAAGQAVAYSEVPEGHNRATWCNHLGTVLAALFAPAR